MVRDAFCKNCDSKLGWIYEFAVVEAQRYIIIVLLEQYMYAYMQMIKDAKWYQKFNVGQNTSK